MEICICFILVFLSAFIFFTKCAVAFDLSEIKKLAEQGDFKAQYQLALMYEDGDGVKRDYAQAVYWHCRAAEQGFDWSQYNLGLMYSEGRGVQQDANQAIAWYRKAAEQGHSGAQHNLSIIYAYGQGVQQDYAQAVAWCRKAVEQGNPDAQHHLGLMYSKGRGVQQDDRQAVTWYRKAAEQGHADAQHNLGVMYTNGRGVLRDYDQAIAWYRRAAEQGEAASQHNLGTMYADGHGVQQDDVQAIHWWRKAAEREISYLQNEFGELYKKGCDYLTQKLGYILYYYYFQHKLLPSIFWGNPEKILKDMEHPEIVLSRLLSVAFEDVINSEDEDDENILRVLRYCILQPHWLLPACVDSVQSILGEKVALEKHSYSDIDIFILKFLAITVWHPPMCERICFLGNKERSRFALYTVEMGLRDFDKSPFGKISIESTDIGNFMLCGHTEDGAHVNYGTAPIGEEAIYTKICNLFNTSS